MVPVEWKKTKHPGVRYYEHATRRHGVGNDRYFAIRYQKGGKRHEEGCGWASEGWTAGKVALTLAELKTAAMTGNGPTRLNEKRLLRRQERKKAAEKQAKAEKERISFSQFAEHRYFPSAAEDKKASSYRAEKTYYKKWIKPAIGHRTFNSIKPLNLERVKRDMLNADKSPRTIEYVFAIVRQIWNMARRDEVITVPSPTRQVKLPRIDNQRLRFLSVQEAEKLLDKLKNRSPQTYRMALLALHCGLRAGEIFSLTWQNIDIDRGIIHVHGKRDKTRPVIMTATVKAMLSDMDRGTDTLVFTGRHGKKVSRVSNAFQRTVKELGFNHGITDRRQRVCFHSLRHSYASWLVEAGTDLYVVQRLLGHSTLSMASRYAHLGPSKLHEAVEALSKKITAQLSATILRKAENK